jgi:hypothetical protein
LTFTGFDTPFNQGLDEKNRWILLSAHISWDVLILLYNNQNPTKSMGRPALSPRFSIGAVITMHLLKLEYRKTVAQITKICICCIF